MFITYYIFNSLINSYYMLIMLPRTTIWPNTITKIIQLFSILSYGLWLLSDLLCWPSAMPSVPWILDAIPSFIAWLLPEWRRTTKITSLFTKKYVYNIFIITMKGCFSFRRCTFRVNLCEPFSCYISSISK